MTSPGGADDDGGGGGGWKDIILDNALLTDLLMFEKNEPIDLAFNCGALVMSTTFTVCISSSFVAVDVVAGGPAIDGLLRAFVGVRMLMMLLVGRGPPTPTTPRGVELGVAPGEILFNRGVDADAFLFLAFIYRRNNRKKRRMHKM